MCRSLSFSFVYTMPGSPQPPSDPLQVPSHCCLGQDRQSISSEHGPEDILLIAKYGSTQARPLGFTHCDLHLNPLPAQKIRYGE